MHGQKNCWLNLGNAACSSADLHSALSRHDVKGKSMPGIPTTDFFVSSRSARWKSKTGFTTRGSLRCHPLTHHRAQAVTPLHPCEGRQGIAKLPGANRSLGQDIQKGLLIRLGSSVPSQICKHAVQHETAPPVWLVVPHVQSSVHCAHHCMALRR